MAVDSHPPNRMLGAGLRNQHLNWEYKCNMCIHDTIRLKVMTEVPDTLKTRQQSAMTPSSDLLHPYFGFHSFFRNLLNYTVTKL